jgi:Asp-tRNA(Asn)/Glu-tRNA(Gln) amidotransferase A subunit family amidase
LKPTVGVVDMDGILLLTSLCDSAGPMAKTVKDITATLNLIAPFQSFEHKTTWDSVSIGFADPNIWRVPAGPTPEDHKIFEQMVNMTV